MLLSSYCRTPVVTHLRKTSALLLMLGVSVTAAGCGGSSVDPTPEKLDGTPSMEFEQEDIDAAESASPAVKDYCSDAVSEAQRVGCESHVTEDELP
jgi:hypothetical protein